MVYLRKDVFPHVLFGTEKRTVHIRTVRFVLQVGESDRSGEKKLSRSRFSFASFLLKRKEDGSHLNRPFFLYKKKSFLQLFPNC